jgi:hypothetical protein
VGQSADNLVDERSERGRNESAPSYAGRTFAAIGVLILAILLAWLQSSLPQARPQLMWVLRWLVLVPAAVATLALASSSYRRRSRVSNLPLRRRVATSALLVATGSFIVVCYMTGRSLLKAHQIVQCGANCRYVIYPAQSYASGHDGHFPPDLQTLIRLGFVSPECCQCPSVSSHNANRIDYVYVSGLTTEDPDDWILCYDTPENHAGEGGHVFYTGGWGVWYDEPQFSQEIEKFRRAFLEARGVEPTLIAPVGRE